MSCSLTYDVYFHKKKQSNDSNLHFEKRQSTSSGKCQSTAQNISTIIKLSQSKRRKFAKANPSGCTFLHALHRWAGIHSTQLSNALKSLQ